MRDEVASRFLGVDDAIDSALAIDGGPVVIADVSDNPGGGAPGDATFFLRRVLERGITSVASGYYYDPMAVRACAEAGLGARFTLRIGGKGGIASGNPVDLDVTVRGLASEVTQRFGDAPVQMGESVWVEAAGCISF
jgi:microcystin degradation protein MlrC